MTILIFQGGCKDLVLYGCLSVLLIELTQAVASKYYNSTGQETRCHAVRLD